MMLTPRSWWGSGPRALAPSIPADLSQPIASRVSVSYLLRPGARQSPTSDRMCDAFAAPAPRGVSQCGVKFWGVSISIHCHFSQLLLLLLLLLQLSPIERVDLHPLVNTKCCSFALKCCPAHDPLRLHQRQKGQFWGLFGVSLFLSLQQ